MTVRDPRYLPPEFRCDVERDGATGCARLAGELDIDTAQQAEAALSRLRSDGCRRIVLDLRELTFIDSTGLRLMMRWNLESRDDGFAFAVVPGPRQVQRLLEITDTAALFTYADPD